MTIQPIIMVTGQALYHHHLKMQLMQRGLDVTSWKKDESEGVWVTYTTYYTYHCLCKNGMSQYREYNLSKN